MTANEPTPRINIRPKYLDRPLPRPRPQPDDGTEEMGSSASTAAPETNTSASEAPSDGPYYPNAHDVLKVRHMLQHAVRDNPTVPGGLPTELVDMIIDTAEYWPSVVVRMPERTVVNQDKDRELLRTGPLCYATPKGSTTPRLQPYRDIHPCRKVEFTIESHDQGWGGGPGSRGTYNGSYTWFDAYVIPRPDCADPSRPPPTPKKDWKEDEKKGQDKEKSNDGDASSNGDVVSEPDDDSEEARYSHHNYFLPTAYSLQRNKVAQRETTKHVVTWHYLDDVDPDSAKAEEVQNASGRGGATLDGRLVRGMNVGDEISIWGRARFPGWSNKVEGLSVRVFWAV